MANHLRQQIREAAAAAVTSLATTGSRVHQSRVYPLEEAGLPALLVSTGPEVVETETLGRPRTQWRTLDLVIEAVARATSNLDDTLDTIAKEVEVALAANGQAWLAGLAKDAELARLEPELDGSGEKPTGRMRLTYEVHYATQETAPDTAL